MSVPDATPIHRFKDEWLVRLVSALPDAPGPQIEQWRRDRKEFLSQALLDTGLLTFEMISALIRNAYRIESVGLDQERPDRAILSLIPEKVARRHHVVPLALDERSISVAMSNPLDADATQDVEAVTGRRMVPLFCPPGRLQELELAQQDPEALIYDLAKKFGPSEKVEVLERESSTETSEGDSAEVGTVKAPVIDLVNGLITQAVRMGASDVHLDHEETSSLVRYRIDGVLRNMMILPRYVAAGPVVARIKIMSGLDISVRMRPQDGRAKLRMGEQTVGIRVSTLPSRNGEKVVLRILDERSIQIPLEDLGFHPAPLQTLKELLGREQGVVLVTGPTGSGKTTTLYAALRKMVSEEVNVITVEDPVEYRLSGITQVQVNERQGLTFPTVLRSVLRQDPDVILIGEIRDAETASVAFQAAQTGHLVLSTLHTNDTISTVVRLADMGVEGFKLATSLLGVTAQRLVRRLCAHCAVDADPQDLPEAVRQAMDRLEMTPSPRAAVGCAECRFTGYRGRLPLIEVLHVTEGVRAAIDRDAPADEIHAAAREDGALRTLDEDTLWHMAEGHTTLEECGGFIQESHLEVLGRGLPVASPPTAQPAPPQRAPAPQPKPALEIVVASGNPALAGSLESQGLVVKTFGDGAAALGAVANLKPGILVVGDGLQTMDGGQVIRTLRTVMGQVDLAIVAVGAEAAGGESVDDTLPADLEPEALAERIRAAMTRRELWPDPAEVTKPPIPVGEDDRLRTLRQASILDTDPEERFDRITREAAEQLRTPMATISLVDADRQWFKSRHGVTERETPREISFCGHGINYPGGFVVGDARMDPRFTYNPLVENGIRAYAGKPIRSPDGKVVGMMCVMDSEPREFTEADLDKLGGLRDQVEKEIWGSDEG